MLRLNPVFTAVALLTLAIGIGAHTAVFSVVNSVLHKPLPYPKAEEPAGVWQTAPGAAGLANFSSGLRLSPSMFSPRPSTTARFTRCAYGCLARPLAAPETVMLGYG